MSYRVVTPVRIIGTQMMITGDGPPVLLLRYQDVDAGHHTRSVKVLNGYLVDYVNNMDRSKHYTLCITTNPASIHLLSIAPITSPITEVKVYV